MIQVEEANLYLLKSIHPSDEQYNPLQEYSPEELQEFPDLLEDDALVVGSKHVMNEVAVFMDNDDIISTTGAFPDRCIIITDLTRDRCKEIIKLGRGNFDRKLKKDLIA